MKKIEWLSRHRPWTRSAAAALLDMSAGIRDLKDIGAQQLDAAVALHRMLLSNACAYLGDEVGMGKTYVALATVALFRHLQPDFRVLYVAPSRNVLEKWHGRELPTFIRNNVRREHRRERASDCMQEGLGAACFNVDDWLRCSVENPELLDTFVPLSALSFKLDGDRKDWRDRVERLAAHGGVTVDLDQANNKDDFKEHAAAVLNHAIPYYDLVIVDEAHLLKGGADAADRLRFLARALGTHERDGSRRFGAALLLSGTPFDRNLLQLARQFQLFAQPRGPGDGVAPHEAIAALAERRRKGEKWQDLQEDLKPYLVRRVQKLRLGDQVLSRNQYRVERRAEAGIRFADDTSQDELRQRIFTAVVQKRLIEHLDCQHGGRFPMAMFSSWEAYSVPRKSAVQPNPEKLGFVDDDAALDRSQDEGASREARTAVDGSLMADLVGSYRGAFGEEPPHPKLETETRRLAVEAFEQGHKQLVFVRRLKSVDDLRLRLNRAYDDWLGNYLFVEGMLRHPDELNQARCADACLRTPSAAANDVGLDGELPAAGDTLFSWFFRGTLDDTGKGFISARQPALPLPSQLRERLRNPERMESIIGELDWRSFIGAHCSDLPEIPVREIAERASQLPGADSPLIRYRRLQAAWAQLLAERLSAERARPFDLLQEHLATLLFETDAMVPAQKIGVETAEALLRVPTVALAFYRHDLGQVYLPSWRSAWDMLAAEAKADDSDIGGFSASEPSARLDALDLQREVLFSLLRLDHPFIDLYLGWLGANRDDGYQSASNLVERLLVVCQRDSLGSRFGTASILRNLAEAWEQIAKTNFADFLQGVGRKPRRQWRQAIQQQLTPFAPIESASGENTKGRSSIARRFRMPGYPIVLVSTSVLQEGEDLHVCCDRVTHFGISGSPIGIEQKNGRVDRIGSLAQRRLLAGATVEAAGIRVSFPHVVDSLEWYQIRDLSLSINDYLRSIHEVEGATGEEATLAETIGSREPIPKLLSYHLSSPFEPMWIEAEGDVCASEMERGVVEDSGVGCDAHPFA
ncbi:DEAD/DEAH box helicase [Burkholderia aenigmatica]|uniref:DEAD/DEAH box helicase family protein n=1 Tax=Burkholderia cepacia complex TaxID=87882 RepID=UPI0013DD997D|nr:MULTISPECIES: DEAD/DEAH box helicase family protein [Burkholderia cepacia complex]VWC59001.1 DEAD/DEAH box helicase [Burkholderia aenigmatica]